jgi:PAS domain S-box-containing protein
MNANARENRVTLKDAFDELKRSEDRFRTFIDIVPALAWCVLPDGSVEFVNQQFLAYTGLSQEEVYRSGWESAVHPGRPHLRQQARRELLAESRKHTITALRLGFVRANSARK